MERTLFKVEHLLPTLRERNGRFGYYGYDIAMRLEKKGHGKICVEGHVGGEHETKVLEAGGSGRYLVKAGFEGGKRERVSLGRNDLYGDLEESDGKSGAEQPEGPAEPDAVGEGGSTPESVGEEGGAGEANRSDR